jgi:2-phospho-L-lactate/phosphoenolpyruvate guanylyltransferase
VPPWSVVVPAKRLAVAKTRMRPVTSHRAGRSPPHEALVLALLADTLTAALASPLVVEVVVVTEEPAAADLARQLGARPVGGEPAGGLNAALEHGAAAVTTAAVAALLADLPALRPAELTAALTAAAGSPRCFVPDIEGTGTTLLTAVGTPLRPLFGHGSSARAHSEDGAVPLTGDWPGLVRDVDTPEGLRTALALGVGRWTADLLAASPTLAVHLGAAR